MEQNQNNITPKPRKVRGTGTFDGERFSFRPSEQGETTQLNVRNTTGGKLFTTTSARKPLQVAHLTCSADCADPWSEYIDQLKRLGVKPQVMPRLPEILRVVSEDGLQCWLNEKKGEMTFTGTINLTQHHRDWQAEVLRQVQLVVRRLPSSEKFNKLIANIKKGGMK